MTHVTQLDRREFLHQGAVVGAAAGGSSAMAMSLSAADEIPPGRKIKVGLIGCGSVSGAYLSQLTKCAHVEVVSLCDIIPERAQRQAKRFKIADHYPHIEKMLAGVPFDLLVNTTDMQEHERLNRQSLEAGKHVWSEKPLANSVAAGQEILDLAKKKSVRIWGAPTVVGSPQFAFMATTLAAGSLGRVAAAHAAYGHTGPNWSSFFYQKGGGSLPDLGVYNLSSMTGLFGPAKSVVAMTSIVTPTREIAGKGQIEVTEEDNAMVLIDHGQGVISHVQSGFNYFSPNERNNDAQRHTITISGSAGSMALVGYDWDPRGVDLATKKQPVFQRSVTDKGDYLWEGGASVVAACLAGGKEPLFTAEHALHVCEIIIAARESQATGKRVSINTTFPWPIVK